MYKFAILAAFAAVPALVAPAQAAPAKTTTTTKTTTTKTTKTKTPKSTTSKTTTPKDTTTSTTTTPKNTTTATTTTTTTNKPAPAKAATDQEKVNVVKAATSLLFVQVMMDESVPVEKKIETVEALAEGVEKTNSKGVEDGVLESAVNILSHVDESVLNNLASYVTTVVSVCEQKNYYGNDRLRTAVRRFFQALAAN